MKKKGKSQSVKHIIGNNVWMLKLVYQYLPNLLAMKIANIPVVILNTYINLNITRWILNHIEMATEIHRIILFVLCIFLVQMIINAFFAIVDIIWTPQKLITLGSKIREIVIEKVSKINQIEFQNNEFYNVYQLSLNEIDSRANQVIDNIQIMLISVLSVLLISGVAATISSGFAILGLIFATIDIIFQIKKKKINYDMDLQCIPDGRKRGYVNRITYQPDFSADLKTYPSFVSLLLDNYRSATQSVKKIILKYSKKNLFVDQMQQIPSVIFKNILPWIWIVVLLTNNKISIPEATVLLAAALTIPNNLTRLLNSIGMLYTHSLYIQRMRNILDIEEDIEKENGIILDSSVSLHIKVENISFAYKKGGKDVIQDFSMEINQGEKIAIVGYNGAGKTTLVKLLIRLYDVNRGQVLLNGQNINEYMVKSVRSRIAFLGQDFKIYSFTVAENILMRSMNDEEDRMIVETALKSVGLYDKVMSWPKGVLTYVTCEFDETGEYLSGGEAQKLALARIYAQNYDCIILDESTSALDPISEDEIIQTIFKIFDKKTIIMISHRLATVKYVDKVYFLSSGILKESGSHKELMENHGEYYKYYSMQAEKYKD